MRLQRCSSSPHRPESTGRVVALAALSMTLLWMPPTHCWASQLSALVEPTPVWTHTLSRAEDPPETLWIFDADFENDIGDNRGWQSYDMSGRVARGDYWHKDTIRIRDFTHLGDSTWWCGRYHSWWRQPRGAGNNWRQWLYRYMPLSEWSDEGDEVVFEWDQRFALENDYDYGYVDFSHDTGETWATFGVYANNGFAGQPGNSHDWDSTSPQGPGHVLMDLSEFAGMDIMVRFRCETDVAYSAQDQYNNPPCNSVLDGAWQLDNFRFTVNDVEVWLDDCESPGENGWIHHSAPMGDETGVEFRRLFEPDTQRGYSCDPETGWMMAAVDSVTGKMVDMQWALLMTPPMPSGGAESIVLECDLWYDFPPDTRDWLAMGVAISDTNEGLDEHAFFSGYYTLRDESGLTLGGALEGPGWTRMIQDITGTAGSKEWFSIGWQASNWNPTPPESHTTGAFLDRVRIGVTMEPDVRTRWSQDHDWRWPDSFDYEEMNGWNNYVRVSDADGVAYVRLLSSVDGGLTWREDDLSIWQYDKWYIEPPLEYLYPGTSVVYYYEAADSLGNTTVFPVDAPDELFEFSFLPDTGSSGDPSILVVDKRRAKVPGDDRRYGFEAEHYVTEALGILGYAYDVYDARDGFDSGDWYGPARGPHQPEAYALYDTHIWLTGDMVRWTLDDYYDQSKLIQWLSGSVTDPPHRLLICGNNIGWDLMEMGNEFEGFFTNWLGASYEDYHAGAHLRTDVPDTIIRVRDAGLGFMTHDDGECWLRCACPDLQYLDVVSPAPGGGAQLALEYVNGLGEVRPAGVAKIDTVLGYRAVFLPFGIELMHDGLDGTGRYRSGIEDRVDLIKNIMEFLGKETSGPGTGIAEGEVFVNRLDNPRPNPFNPLTTVAFSLASEGHTSIRVFDCAGRVVRTLVDTELESGPRTVTWDGTTDTGSRAASGVYFVRMEATGAGDAFKASRKLVLLK